MLNKSGPGCGDSGFMVRRQQRSVTCVEDAGPRVTSRAVKNLFLSFSFSNSLSFLSIYETSYFLDLAPVFQNGTFKSQKK